MNQATKAPEIPGDSDIRIAVAGMAGRLPPELAPLAELAFNYWWSWAEGGPQLFDRIYPERWDRACNNPVRLLEEVPRTRLAELVKDATFLADMQVLAAGMRRALNGPSALGDDNAPVVHMCAEFGVHPSLPIYAGGLGVLMGDFLKQESDQRVAAMGLGLLYSQGSFQQRLDQSGWQHEYWLDTDAERLPMVRVTDGGLPLKIRVPARGHDISVQVWRANVGRVPLFLLDSNLMENTPSDRWITSRLYVGDREMRMAQYAILGIGGIRALREMGIAASLIHLNEGHAALAGLEMVREAIEDGFDFETAVQHARQMTAFTTHTPVAAGHDTFSPDDVRQSAGTPAGQRRARLGALHGPGAGQPGRRGRALRHDAFRDSGQSQHQRCQR